MRPGIYITKSQAYLYMNIMQQRPPFESLPSTSLQPNALSELTSLPPYYQVEIRPIAFFRQSEEIDQIAVMRLAELIHETGYWTVPIPVCLDTGIIMDGNHRLSAARHLNLSAIPCIPLRYEDPRIAIECWKTGVALKPAEIVQQILVDGTLPHKSTRHIFSPALPEAKIPLATLTGHMECSSIIQETRR